MLGGKRPISLDERKVQSFDSKEGRPLKPRYNLTYLDSMEEDTHRLLSLDSDIDIQAITQLS